VSAGPDTRNARPHGTAQLLGLRRAKLDELFASVEAGPVPDGEYRGTFVSAEAGAYEVTVDATRSGGQTVGSGSGFVRAGPGEAEFFDPTMHGAPLRRIAEETGGRFYTADNVKGLAEDIRYAGRGVTSVEQRELWNMPIILIALMGLVCAEWGYRRLVGLA